MENIFNKKLYPKLEKDNIFKKDKLDSFVHSLVDIQESMNKIYNQFIPKLLENKTIADLEEVIWDIREEFRHIEYHIEDADLTNISLDNEEETAQ